MQRMSRRPHGWSGPGSAEEVEWLVGAEPPVQVVVVQLRALRPQVPKPPRCSPGAANRTCILSARVGMWSKCCCSGVSNPIRIPERRAAGWVWGRPPPTCAGSSRWVPSLEGLGQAKTPRCLPRHVVRVVSAPTRSPWFLLAPEPRVASGWVATDVPQGCMAAWCSPGTSTIGFGLGRVRRGELVT